MAQETFTPAGVRANATPAMEMCTPQSSKVTYNLGYRPGIIAGPLHFWRSAPADFWPVAQARRIYGEKIPGTFTARDFGPGHFARRRGWPHLRRFRRWPA